MSRPGPAPPQTRASRAGHAASTLSLLQKGTRSAPGYRLRSTTACDSSARRSWRWGGDDDRTPASSAGRGDLPEGRGSFPGLPSSAGRGAFAKKLVSAS